MGIWLMIIHINRYETRSNEWKKKKGKRKEMFYLMTHSIHFIYGYMAMGIWLRIIHINRYETRSNEWMKNGRKKCFI